MVSNIFINIWRQWSTDIDKLLNDNVQVFSIQNFKFWITYQIFLKLFLISWINLDLNFMLWLIRDIKLYNHITKLSKISFNLKHINHTGKTQHKILIITLIYLLEVLERKEKIQIIQMIQIRNNQIRNNQRHNN